MTSQQNKEQHSSCSSNIKDSAGTESLSGFTSRMNVKKYIGDSNFFYKSRDHRVVVVVTGGGSTGFFSSGAGFGVSGGMTLDASVTGASGVHWRNLHRNFCWYVQRSYW